MDLTIEALEKTIKEIQQLQRDKGLVIAIKPTKLLLFPEQFKDRKMYKILRNGKRFNNKAFATYEDARKYVRRKVTQLVGYNDDYTFLGFSITK